MPLASVLVSCSLAHTLMAGAPVPLTADELVKLAETAAAKGDGKKAAGYAEKALSTSPALSAALAVRAEQALGMALLQQRQPALAATHLQKVVDAEPAREKAWLMLGMALDSAEQFPAALAAYEQGSRSLPKSSSLRREWGMSLLQAGKADDAARTLVDAAVLAPSDPEVHTDAAYALVLARRFSDAKEHVALALDLGPASPDTLYTLGNAELGLGHAKAARDAWTNALDIEELHAPSLLQLGLLDVQEGQTKAGAARFLRILQVEPTHARAQGGLGVIARQLIDAGDAKQLDEARAVVAAGLARDPRWVGGLALLAELAEQKGDIAGAIAKWEQVRALRPDDARVIDKLTALKKQRPKP